jgi:hypothetical protein
MSWSGLRVALRRVIRDGPGVFFVVSANPRGRHQGHAVVRAGSLHIAGGGPSYSDSVIDEETHLPWRTLWSS